MNSFERSCDTSVAARIVHYLAGAAREARVAEVRIGLGYTAVLLADGRAGVAYTFRDQAQGCCSIFNGVQPSSSRLAADLLPLLTSHDAIAAGVGLACANALANGDQAGYLEGDVLEHLGVQPDDDIAMVGHFGPLVEELRRRARSLTVFERVAEPTAQLQPQAQAPAALSRCQVALITATAVINHTVDTLLEAARNCRVVALLGASTPMLPAVFAAARVTMLAGIVIKEPHEVLRVISEGGGMRQFRPHVRKISLKTNSFPSTAARSIQ